MVKTKEEIAILKEGGALLARILHDVAAQARAGVTTAFLSVQAEQLIREAGARPSFLGYHPEGMPSPYPAALCVSVNDEVVHAIPSEKRMLKEGDIVGLDLGLWLNDLCVDAALTVGIGTITPQARKLVEVTRQALYEGIAAVRHGARTGDVGHAIQTYVEKHGFSIVRDLAGHGVGYKVHEDPMILNFGKKGTGEVLTTGMVLALEPMVNEGDWRVKIDKDGWGIRTGDGKLSAHFEHTIVVTDEGCEILTEVKS